MNALSSLPYFALDTSSGLHTPTSWFLFCFLNWTVSINLIDPPCKDGNARFTTIPLKPVSDKKKYKRYRRFSDSKSPLFLLISPLVFFAHDTFEEKSQSFQGYCIKSDTVIFTWRFTWNYAYSPFNSPGSCINSGIRKLIQPRNELARKYRFNSFNIF